MKKVIVILILSELCLFFFSFGILEAHTFYKCDYNKYQDKPANFKEVDANYYRSGKIHNCDYANLSKIGIKTIIDLRLNLLGSAKKENFSANNAGIKYFNIPMNPIIPPNKEQINQFFSIVTNQNNLPVLVHCVHGQDRTGIMTALYRIRNNNWTFNQAYKEMLNNGYHPYRYFRQKEFLLQYSQMYS